MDMDRRRLRIGFIVVCFVAGAVGAGIAFNQQAAVPIENGVTLQTPDGLAVTVDGTGYANLEDPFGALGGTLDVTTDQGNATFYSPGDANATIHLSEIEGPWTNVTAIDADPNTIQINPADKPQVTVGQEIDAISFTGSYTLDDGTVDFVYDGSGPSEAIIEGVPADTRMAAVDAGSNQILDGATSDSNGAVTFDALDSGSHTVLIQTFSPTAPTISNPAPTGETANEPTQLSVDVADGDFPRGDAVTVTFDLDGSQIHSETITSNQTVTASVPASGKTGGSHSWSVDVSDDYGESASDSYSYSVPTNLTIYDEETEKVIDGQQVNLTVYTRGDNPDILSFNTSNGEVDLGSGFPATEPFVVVAESEGYLDRRIFVQSVYQTQDIYLLNESLQHTDVIFRIEDYTGRYPPDETVLEVQRGINGSWETVLGDYFGANDQFESQIRYNTRHRLVLVNSETGERRVLGTYTPLASGTETITVSPEAGIELPEEYPTIDFVPGARSLPGENGVNVSSTIANGTEPLQSWSVKMYHINGGTNTTVFSESGSDPTGGSKQASLALADKQGTIKVVTTYTLDGGGTGSQVATYSIQPGTSRSMTLLDGIVGFVATIPGENSNMVMTLVSMILVVVGTAAVGSRFRLSSEGMGVVTLALVTAFSILGFLPYSLLFTVLVLFGSLTFLRRRY